MSNGTIGPAGLALPRVPGRIVRVARAGSHAHGLATPASDVDLAGVYVASTLDLAGLDERRPPESVVTTAPDAQLHEIGKVVRLALRANPTVLETVAAPAELEDGTGRRLRLLLPRLLSDGAVRAAYLGYAAAQLRMLEGPHPVGTRRGDKHARHAFRVLETLERLLRTGELRAAVDDPAWYLQELPTWSHERVRDGIAARATALEGAPSALPAAPDLDAAAAFLDDVRREHLERTG